MPRGSAVQRSTPGARGDCTETNILQEAKALVESGPCELPRHDYELLAVYVASHRSDTGECHQLLARALAASPLASQAFACFPTQMAGLCLEALRSGTEKVRDLIEQHRLRTHTNAAGTRSPLFKVFALGRFQVLKDDVPVRFTRRAQRKPFELLQALLAFGGTEVGAGRLTDALWPDSEGDAGYHALESALYRLRQLLGCPSAVAMKGGQLTLDRRQFWVDMWAFESELRRGTTGGSRADQLAAMRELYVGDFLAQETDKPWAVEKRQMLRDKFVRLIRDFARDYEGRGLWAEAAAMYQVGIEVDSLGEEFYRGLITCHRRLGDYGAAVQAYRRCSELLQKKLGVQPSPKTLALYQSIRHEAVSHAV